jgi:DNA helicase-2/ATP-dependent DNA helicase PcrA
LPPPEAASRLAEIASPQREAEKQRLFHEEGLLHFDLFAKVSAELLTRSQSLAAIVSDAYPVIILDEFQDTNRDEWSLIQTLGKRTCLIALADPEQRIYEFRGADPRRIGEFIAAYSPRQFDFGSENHRSAGTDIIAFGNDLLSGSNKSKTYNDVVTKAYGFYGGRSAHFVMKTELLQGISRLHKNGPVDWSLAVLVATKRMMLSVSDYLLLPDDGLPVVHHDVALDTEGPCLSASLIAGLLEAEDQPEVIVRRLLLDLCSHMRGRSGGNTPTQADLKLLAAVSSFLESGEIRGKNRQQLVSDVREIAEKRLRLTLSGDPGEDWLSVKALLSEVKSEPLHQVAEDAKYLRLLHKGAALRAKLGELWRTNGSYDGATTAVRDALLHEHFSVSTRQWIGVHVMTIHKSKGKEFDEVFIYEGTHQGRIVRQNTTESEIAQARLSLRVAVTRARVRATILTPRNDTCPFL